MALREYSTTTTTSTYKRLRPECQGGEEIAVKMSAIEAGKVPEVTATTTK